MSMQPKASLVPLLGSSKTKRFDSRRKRNTSSGPLFGAPRWVPEGTLPESPGFALLFENG